jgi:hypothetical protein
MLNDCQQDCFARDCFYVHIIKHQWVYAEIYNWISFWQAKKNTHGRNVFWFMKLEESKAGEDSEPEGMCSELAGTHFTIRKIKFR